jgi:hypothetical protein
VFSKSVRHITIPTGGVSGLDDTIRYDYSMSVTLDVSLFKTSNTPQLRKTLTRQYLAVVTHSAMNVNAPLQ